MTCVSRSVRTSYRGARAVRGEKTVDPVTYLSPAFTLSPPAHYFLRITCPRVLSFHKIKRLFCTGRRDTKNKPGDGVLRRLYEPPAHQSGYISVFWELVEFTFNIRISKVLAALWPRLLTRQSRFVPPDVFRALSQQFLLRCIRTYIQCGTWRTAKPALLKVVLCKKCPSGLIYFHFSHRHL